MSEYLVTLRTESFEDIRITADSRDEVMALISSGAGETVHEWRYGSSVESIEELDA